MRRAVRLSTILLVSVSLAASLFATAWIVPRRRRGRYRTVFQRAWCRALCGILRIRVEVIGEFPDSGELLVVSNHLGYADIPVLGSVLPVVFVSKSEVARWPLIGPLATLGGTEFVDREDRLAAGRFPERLAGRIASGDRVLVFPEGTSSRGGAILPFRTVPFAAVAGSPGRSVLPVYVDVVEIDGRPAAGQERDVVCWHGNADFVPHAFRLMGLREIRYRVVIGLPVPCEDLDRKALSRISRDRVDALEKVSARRGRMLPGNFIRVHPVP